MFYFYAQWKGEKRSMHIISLNPKTKNPFKYLPRNKFFHQSCCATSSADISKLAQSTSTSSLTATIMFLKLSSYWACCCCCSCSCFCSHDSLSLSLMRTQQKFCCCRRWLFTIFKLLSHLFGAKTLKHNIKNLLYDIVELLFQRTDVCTFVHIYISSYQNVCRYIYTITLIFIVSFTHQLSLTRSLACLHFGIITLLCVTCLRLDLSLTNKVRIRSRIYLYLPCGKRAKV